MKYTSIITYSQIQMLILFDIFLVKFKKNNFLKNEMCIYLWTERVNISCAKGVDR